MATLLASYGRLWAKGARLTRRDAYAGERRKRLPLPGYPFERTRHWLPAQQGGPIERAQPQAPAVAPVAAPVAVDTPRAAAVETDDVRHALTRIWTECLGHERITPTDDFFALGGDSLLAGRVLARIHERLNAELTLEAFFSAPTIDGLACAIHMQAEPAQPAERAAMTPDGRPAAGPRRAPMSFQQRRLWTLERLGMGGSVFHLPQCLHLHGDVDRAALHAALGGLVARHPVLRTSFHEGRTAAASSTCMPTRRSRCRSMRTPATRTTRTTRCARSSRSIATRCGRSRSISRGRRCSARGCSNSGRAARAC